MAATLLNTVKLKFMEVHLHHPRWALKKAKGVYISIPKPKV